LIAGIEILNNHISDDHVTDWRLIRGLFLNAVYGGRVDNDFDLRVLGEYLNKAFNAECESKISLMSYLSPPSNTINSVMTQVNNVKDVDDPDMFGLPADVEKKHFEVQNT